MDISRRKFVELTALAPLAYFVPFRNVKLGDGRASSAALYEKFRQPSDSTRPFVRWWWNGDRLAKKEILRELDILKAAGIGGVEINPIRFPDNTDDLGIKSLEWLSDEWIDMLHTALVGAKEKGIICDMIVGSGWPFGGRFLERKDQIQMASLGTRKLSGGVVQLTKKELLDSVNPHIYSKYEDPQKALLMVNVAPAEVNDFSQCKEVTDQFQGDVLKLTLPEGTYTLYYVVKLTGFMAVINGAPGAGGPVLNHYSKSSVANYLNRMSDRLKAKIGPLGNYFRAFFTDSLELEGANWADDIFAEFERRKQYDIRPYFPFILFKTGAMGNAVQEEFGSRFSSDLQDVIERVRYDFEEVRVQLFKERFLNTFVDWCHDNGVQSRMQAYGRPCNPVEASMSLDIPECETWLGNGAGAVFSMEDYRKGRAYTMVNKMVASGAHLAGKKVVSCEEMTNTSMVFNASLETLKIAGDQSILSGVTHSVLHGFNYSPLEAPFPGWVRYGTFLNERNPWWPFFRHWADYKNRLYTVFQHAEMQADIAIVPPLADLAGKFGFQRDPFPSFAYPKYVYQVWEAVHQCGNGCDYVTEHIVQQSEIKDGRLYYNGRSYNTLVLIDLRSILPETAEMIRQFTKAGGKLICIERSPDRSPAFKGAAGKKEAKIDLLRGTDPARAGVVPAPKTDFISWYQNIQQQFNITPYVQWRSPEPFISQVYYKVGDADFFFISNYNKNKGYELDAVFNIHSDDKNAWIWDPMTGSRYRCSSAAKGNTMQIGLGPAESRLIVFDNEKAEAQPFDAPPFEPDTALAIDGTWTVHLNPLAGAARTLSMAQLTVFSQRDDLKTFGGHAVYENTFAVADPADLRYLQIGQCAGVAEIEINGKKAGLQWYGRPVHDISGLLKKGKNSIRVKVTFTLGNYMKSLKDNAVAQSWVGHQPLHSAGLLGPVRLI